MSGGVAVPTVLNVGPYRFHFWSKDRDEPPHIHVQRDEDSAKFWLDPVVRVAKNNGFSETELNRIRKEIMIMQEQLLDAWLLYFHGE
jgi:hypothetical protein